MKYINRDSSHVFDFFKQVDPFINNVMKGIDFGEWFPEVKPDDYFIRLCQTIIGQQLSGKAANTIEARVLTLLPDHTITQEHILAVADQAYRDAGMSWAKVAYIKDLADKVQSNQLRLNKLPDMEDESVILELTKVRGIGRWTAEMFLMFSLGREDVFSHGDLGLKRGLEKLYRLQDPNRDEVEMIVSKWSPYKSYGSVALWHYLES